MNNKTWGFGLSFINKTTPQIAQWIFRIALYIGAIIDMIIVEVPNINPSTKAIIVAISAASTIATHMITRLFGVKQDPNDEVIKVIDTIKEELPKKDPS